MIDTEKLLTCPHCGCERIDWCAVYTDDGREPINLVYCADCESSIKMPIKAGEEIINAWNYAAKKNSMDQLIKDVIDWGNDRDLIKHENAARQSQKIMEELGETMSADLKGDREKLIDGIGDVLVTIILYAKMHDLEIRDCLEAAYNEIKNRTGKTENGTFIKLQQTCLYGLTNCTKTGTDCNSCTPKNYNTKRNIK